MNALFALHSVLRYVVLVDALICLVFFGAGLVSKRPADRTVRILGASFVGLLDLQIVLGVVLVALGRFYPQLIGHLVMMVLAAAVAHVAFAVNRRKAAPGHALPFAGVAVALVLIVGGILAIGRSILGSSAF